MPNKKIDKRTAGEKQRDATISLMDKRLICMSMQVERMEKLAALRKSYSDAQNYKKIIDLIKNVREAARK